DERYQTRFLLNQKAADFSDALARSQGAVVDCLADDEMVTPGQTFAISIQVYTDAGAQVRRVTLNQPQGWAAQMQKESATTTDGRLAAQRDFKVTVAADAEATEPYWLKHPRKGDMFEPGAGGTGIEPVAPPVISASVELEIAGEPVVINQPAQFRFADKALGEIRREL